MLLANVKIYFITLKESKNTQVCIHSLKNNFYLFINLLKIDLINKEYLMRRRMRTKE